MQIQATRPQTLAYGLTDSPAGPFTWTADKSKQRTHPQDALPEAAVELDQMLANVSLYWLTGTAASAARLYYENMHAGSWGEPTGRTPTGVAVVAHAVAIRRYAKQGNNVLHWSEFDRRGHVAAMEVTDADRQHPDFLPHLAVASGILRFRRLRLGAPQRPVGVPRRPAM